MRGPQVPKRQLVMILCDRIEGGEYLPGRPLPPENRPLTERELDAALEAVADFTDVRSPCRAGHSRGVARLAASAAGLCGLPGREIVTVRRAALVHDLGLHGVPASILDKPGPLSGTET